MCSRDIAGPGHMTAKDDTAVDQREPLMTDYTTNRVAGNLFLPAQWTQGALIGTQQVYQILQ